MLLVGALLAGRAALDWRRESGLRRVEAWMPQIEVAASEAGIDAFLLAGVVYAESRGAAEARSSIGALGLCQLMPATAEELAMRLRIAGPPYEPADNLRMGARYLRELLNRWDDDVDLALLGYRMGPTRVARELRENGREVWLAGLRTREVSPWNYRTQVLESAATLRARATAR